MVKPEVDSAAQARFRTGGPDAPGLREPLLPRGASAVSPGPTGGGSSAAYVPPDRIFSEAVDKLSKGASKAQDRELTPALLAFAATLRNGSDSEVQDLLLDKDVDPDQFDLAINEKGANRNNIIMQLAWSNLTDAQFKPVVDAAIAEGNDYALFRLGDRNELSDAQFEALADSGSEKVLSALQQRPDLKDNPDRLLVLANALARKDG